MRKLHNSDYRQRGCLYCADTVKVPRRVNGQMAHRVHCIHEECPYHELDNIESYFDYLKDFEGDTISEILKALGIQ